MCIWFPVCSCDSAGTEGTVCNAVGGQCPCKPGVMLEDCRQCMVDYYGFDSGNGCTGKPNTPDSIVK